MRHNVVCGSQVQDDNSCFVASLIAIFDVSGKSKNLFLCVSSRPKSSLFDTMFSISSTAGDMR